MRLALPTRILRCCAPLLYAHLPALNACFLQIAAGTWCKQVLSMRQLPGTGALSCAHKAGRPPATGGQVMYLRLMLKAPRPPSTSLTPPWLWMPHTQAKIHLHQLKSLAVAKPQRRCDVMLYTSGTLWPLLAAAWSACALPIQLMEARLEKTRPCIACTQHVDAGRSAALNLVQKRLTYRLTLSYNGSAFEGWAYHPDPAQNTVCNELLRCLAADFPPPAKLVLEAAGRTDAGVHACGQVASFYSWRSIPPAVVLQVCECWQRRLSSQVLQAYACLMHERGNRTVIFSVGSARTNPLGAGNQSACSGARSCRTDRGRSDAK